MTTATAARRGARKAARSDSVQRLARLGLVGRGTLYVVVAILAANIARGSRAEADRQGALRVVGSHWTGRVLLAVIALGFAGYALWRVLEATVLPGDKKWPGRLAALAKAALYTAFTVTTAKFALTHHAENANRKHMSLAARVMEWPLGRWLVAAFGVGLVVAGGVNVYRGVSRRFRKHLKEHELGKNARQWVFTVAIAGLVSRGVAFALVGFFVVQAAVTYDPRKAQGLDATFRSLARAPYGRPLLVLVAIGLTAFGAWCFVEARYRRVLNS